MAAKRCIWLVLPTTSGHGCWAMQAISVHSQISIMDRSNTIYLTGRAEHHQRRFGLPGAARKEFNGIHRQCDPKRDARRSNDEALKTTARKVVIARA